METHPCARCATLQRTCCQRAEVLVTDGDVLRIAAHTGRAGFHEWRAPSDPAYAAHDPTDPSWQALTVRSDGTRRVLARTPAGDCTFLGAAGCTLPEGVRPLVCRLYPWSYTDSGLLGEDHEYCPTAVLQPPDGSMAALLGLARADAEHWRSMLYAELRAAAAATEKLTCASA